MLDNYLSTKFVGVNPLLLLQKPKKKLYERTPERQ